MSRRPHSSSSSDTDADDVYHNHVGHVSVQLDKYCDDCDSTHERIFCPTQARLYRGQPVWPHHMTRLWNGRSPPVQSIIPLAVPTLSRASSASSLSSVSTTSIRRSENSNVCSLFFTIFIALFVAGLFVHVSSVSTDTVLPEQFVAKLNASGASTDPHLYMHHFTWAYPSNVEGPKGCTGIEIMFKGRLYCASTSGTRNISDLGVEFIQELANSNGEGFSFRTDTIPGVPPRSILTQTMPIYGLRPEDVPDRTWREGETTTPILPITECCGSTALCAISTTTHLGPFSNNRLLGLCPAGVTCNDAAVWQFVGENRAFTHPCMILTESAVVSHKYEQYNNMPDRVYRSWQVGVTTTPPSTCPSDVDENIVSRCIDRHVDTYIGGAAGHTDSYILSYLPAFGSQMYCRPRRGLQNLTSGVQWNYDATKGNCGAGSEPFFALAFRSSTLSYTPLINALWGLRYVVTDADSPSTRIVPLSSVPLWKYDEIPLPRFFTNAHLGPNLGEVHHVATSNGVTLFIQFDPVGLNASVCDPALSIKIQSPPNKTVVTNYTFVRAVTPIRLQLHNLNHSDLVWSTAVCRLRRAVSGIAPFWFRDERFFLIYAHDQLPPNPYDVNVTVATRPVSVNQYTEYRSHPDANITVTRDCYNFTRDVHHVYICTMCRETVSVVVRHHYNYRAFSDHSTSLKATVVNSTWRPNCTDVRLDGVGDLLISHADKSDAYPFDDGTCDSSGSYLHDLRIFVYCTRNLSWRAIIAISVSSVSLVFWIIYFLYKLWLRKNRKFQSMKLRFQHKVRLWKRKWYASVLIHIIEVFLMLVRIPWRLLKYLTSQVLLLIAKVLPKFIRHPRAAATMTFLGYGVKRAQASLLCDTRHIDVTGRWRCTGTVPQDDSIIGVDGWNPVEAKTLRYEWTIHNDSMFRELIISLRFGWTSLLVFGLVVCWTGWVILWVIRKVFWPLIRHLFPNNRTVARLARNPWMGAAIVVLFGLVLGAAGQFVTDVSCLFDSGYIANGVMWCTPFMPVNNGVYKVMTRPEGFSLKLIMQSTDSVAWSLDLWFKQMHPVFQWWIVFCVISVTYVCYRKVRGNPVAILLMISALPGAMATEPDVSVRQISDDSFRFSSVLPIPLREGFSVTLNMRAPNRETSAYKITVRKITVEYNYVPQSYCYHMWQQLVVKSYGDGGNGFYSSNPEWYWFQHHQDCDAGFFPPCASKCPFIWTIRQGTCINAEGCSFWHTRYTIASWVASRSNSTPSAVGNLVLPRTVVELDMNGTLMSVSGLTDVTRGETQFKLYDIQSYTVPATDVFHRRNGKLYVQRSGANIYGENGVCQFTSNTLINQPACSVNNGADAIKGVITYPLPSHSDIQELWNLNWKLYWDYEVFNRGRWDFSEVESHKIYEIGYAKEFPTYGQQALTEQQWQTFFDVDSSVLENAEHKLPAGCRIERVSDDVWRTSSCSGGYAMLSITGVAKLRLTITNGEITPLRMSPRKCVNTDAVIEVTVVVRVTKIGYVRWITSDPCQPSDHNFGTISDQSVTLFCRPSYSNGTLTFESSGTKIETAISCQWTRTRFGNAEVKFSALEHHSQGWDMLASFGGFFSGLGNLFGNIPNILRTVLIIILVVSLVGGVGYIAYRLWLMRQASSYAKRLPR